MPLSDLEITVRGMTFNVAIEHDDMGPPWKEHDGHGQVREVTRDRGDRPDKRPGELMLNKHAWQSYLYDFAGACRQARMEGWGEKRDGETPRQRAVRAVMQDFNYLKGWVNDEWYWVSVDVSPTGVDDIVASLSGIESDAYDYIKDVAHDLAEDVLHMIEKELGEKSMTGTFGYVQFWVLGNGGGEEKEPVHHTKFARLYDADGQPQLLPPRQFFGYPYSEEEKIQRGRDLCLQYRMLGFTLHDNDGKQIRELELTNVWAEGLRTNE